MRPSRFAVAAAVVTAAPGAVPPAALAAGRTGKDIQARAGSPAHETLRGGGRHVMG
ncbi:hypothetical protein ABZ743_06395 [Streptomyces sp. NPDC006662]|uniref:hypothetical protein n=1 Tax=Streptomyces sp. NPDC006662 TaxID=3156902 RepID=UPI0033DE07D3